MQYSRAKGQNHFTRTAGHPSFEAAHNAAGLPEPVGLCPAFCPWELPNPSLQGCTQWVHLPSPGAAPCTLTCWTSWGSQGPSSQVCPGPLDGIPFFSCINGTAQLHVLCRLAEDTFDLTVSLIKVLKSTGPKVESWGGHHSSLVSTWTQSHWLKPSGCAASIQPNPYPPQQSTL